MSFAATESASPLSGLSRASTRTRRASPYYDAQSRRGSPISVLAGTKVSTPEPRMSSLDNDDSDDEGKAPQLSALAQMLLDDFSETDGEKEGKRTDDPIISASAAKKTRLSWSQSPGSEDHQTARASYGSSSSGERNGSPDYAVAKEMITPAPGRHPRRVFSGTYSVIGSSGERSGEENKEIEHKYVPPASYNSIIRPGPGQVSSTASALRWKRSGRGLLGGLAGRPRRGPRRDSDQTTEEGREENDDYPKSSPGDDAPLEQDQGDESRRESPTSREEQREDGMMIERPLSTISRRSRRASPEILSSSQQSRVNVYQSGTPEDNASSDVPSSSSQSVEELRRTTPPVSSSSLSRAAAIAAAAAAMPSAMPSNEKENMPPPTFRRPNAAASIYKRLAPNADEKPSLSSFSPSRSRTDKPLVVSPAQHRMSPEHKPVLSMKSNNTPLRPAPPPPRMSMLQTVTATAGASSTSASQSARRSRATVHINGKAYRRLDAIGKGGSSKVYKVMAENFKMFAMKKVTFHEQDGESTIRGYKGEIELLKKLSAVDRVIQLYDYEINDEKQNLTMLMECGETDLAKVLTLRHGADDSTLDVAFVRYYWREMLQCVDVVHTLNIIHSDLKPANFLLVQGRLKLIDFGIANAIQDDTVNVHRESQVGTLNYMSPEAIVDINASSGKPMASVGQPRLMKLGAPSDVWSLGCILYQMTYGKTPFSHLTSMYQKISAIPDPSYPIEYPYQGIGDIPVPRSLIETIKGCLDRDKYERPTIRQLLAEDDPFLNPDRYRDGFVGITEEMLRTLLENACNHCEKNGRPSSPMIGDWAKDVYTKLGRRMHSPNR